MSVGVFVHSEVINTFTWLFNDHYNFYGLFSPFPYDSYIYSTLY